MLSTNKNLLTGTNFNNMLREVPRHQEHYLGIVKSRFEDNTEDSDENPRNYKIKFNILGLPEFTNEWPIAVSLGNSTRPVNEGDLVKIWDICDSTPGAHMFFYEPIWEDRFTGIKNYDNYIDMTEKNYVEMKFPNTKLVFDKSGGQKQGTSDTADNTKGEIKIEAGGSSISINCTTGAIDVKAKSGSTININGTPATGFCCIPSCPYTGATHTTNTVITQ
ncbi:MAG: hypothetical protein MJZ34_02920 [Paludibacteraceae bacterium]|nr:hypothetical protein [Paludibacteraceae bacterium]